MRFKPPNLKELALFADTIAIFCGRIKLNDRIFDSEISKIKN